MCLIQCRRSIPCACPAHRVSRLLFGRLAKIKNVLLPQPTWFHALGAMATLAWPCRVSATCSREREHGTHQFRSVERLIGALIVLLCCLSRPAGAQDVIQQLSPWGRFEPGAWKLVRVLTENFNEQGAAAGTNTSDCKTTLLDADDDGITLEMRVCVEMAGKRFDGEPQTIKQNYYGEKQSRALKLKEPAPGQVTIEDRKINCQVREVELPNADGKTIAKIYYSPSVPPYVLKRESTSTDSEGKKILSEITVSVQALDMPCKISGALHNAAYVKTVQKTPKGTIYTLAVTCPEIPGGIVSHTSKELDPSGRLIRRSTLELLDYSAEPEKSRAGVFGRKRASRYRGN
jgi:hypothetical protein